MIKNYFKTAWRNLFQNKFLSAIKILGLSIGLTVCMLIFLYTKDEITFDRFHANKETIYRVFEEMHLGRDVPQKMGITRAPLGEAFHDEIPEVKERVRMLGIPVT